MSDPSVSGRLTVEAGTLQRVPAIDALERQLGGVGLQGLAYKAVSLRFALERDNVVFEPFTLSTDEVVFCVAGESTIGQNPRIALQLVARLSSSALHNVRIRGLTEEIVEAFTDQSGWLAIPLRLTGDLDSPDVEVDISAGDVTALLLEHRRGQDLRLDLGLLADCR